MTDWCTADWNALASSFGFVDWHVHSTSERDAWDYATAIISVITSVVAAIVAIATLTIAQRQKALLLHDSLMKAYEKYDSLYQKVRDGLLNFGTTGKIQDALDCFRNAREVAILYQYPKEIRDYCQELEAAATSAIMQENVTQNVPSKFYAKDKVIEASNKLSELRSKYTVSQALSFFSEHRPKL